MKARLPSSTRFRAIAVTFPVGVVALLVLLLVPHQENVAMTVLLPLLCWMMCANGYRMVAMARGTDRARGR